MSTIAAISTPPAAGGVAMLRISGEGAIDVAARVFVPLGKTAVGEMSGHTCAYGHVVDGGEVLDDAVLTIFRAPSSYTGENVAEITCHGGIYVSRRVLRAILAAGAEPAQPGEFTKRAFLNGKLSLTQAEAVADIISAEGDSALKSANLMHGGRLFREISAVRDNLVHVLGSLAAWTDYPEEDLPEASPENVAEELEQISQKIKKVIDSYDTGIIFRDGIRCAIVGRPNVGKSTLMNALLGYERSIVTPTAGTTRDVVEESLRLGDVVLKICDTAGLRDSDDEAERIGVKLAERAIENAQLILAVFDGSRPTDDEDEKILEKIANRRHLIIVNKSDLPQKIDLEYFKDENILFVSAKDGDGLKKIADAVYEMFGLSGAGQSEVYANERQRGCCERAQSQIRQAVDALAAGVTLDAVTVLLDSAADALLELTGERATEAVVNDVFGRFCVGK